MKEKKFIVTIAIPDDCNIDPTSEKIAKIIREHPCSCNCIDCAVEVEDAK